MSNTNVIKRREAYTRWASKNKAKRRKYQRVLYEAKKANPIPQTCSIVGCSTIGERHHPDYSKPELVVWICRFHHRRTKHSASCTLCGAKAVGRGLCNKHYKHERRKEPDFVLAQRRMQRTWRAKLQKQ